MDVIKNYTIVKSDSLTELISMVNDYLNDVWQPTGGVHSTTETINDKEVITFYQALVEYYPKQS